MPETGSMIGYGSLFAVSQDGGTTWTDLAEVTEITPPSATFDVVEATHMQSPDSTKEFILGLNDPGEASLTLNHIPGSATDLKIQEIRAARLRVMCRLTWPNGVIWTFSGLLTNYAPTDPLADRLTATVTFKVTGSTVTEPAAAPVNSVLPAVSGIAQVGETLTALVGVWAGGGSHTYQWEEDDDGWSAIAGATSATYVPAVGNVGNPLRVVVTATNGAGTASATSAPTAAVLAA